MERYHFHHAIREFSRQALVTEEQSKVERPIQRVDERFLIDPWRELSTIDAAPEHFLRFPTARL